MKNLIKRVYHYYAPNWLKQIYRRRNLKRDNIIKWDEFESVPGAEKEYQYTIKYRLFSAIPYKWSHSYHAGHYKFKKDEKGYFCTIFKGGGDAKKLYFPEKYALDGTAGELVNSLMIEQDKRSPHHYFSEHVKISDGDVLLDIGAAEGLITLWNIDKVKKAYLFECEPDWIDALEKTFAPYKSKVEIVNKFVSGFNDESHTTLDHFIEQHASDNIVLKMDIEGMEIEVVSQGLGANLGRANLKFACCTYHRADDAETLKKLFAASGYEVEFSDGFMVWGFEAPYIRKGIIRAWK